MTVECQGKHSSRRRVEEVWPGSLSVSRSELSDPSAFSQASPSQGAPENSEDNPGDVGWQRPAARTVVSCAPALLPLPQLQVAFRSLRSAPIGRYVLAFSAGGGGDLPTFQVPATQDR